MSHYIYGEWKKATGSPLSSTNPATGEMVWQGFAATPSEVEAAVAAAKKAFPTWAATPLAERAAALNRYDQELKLSADKLAIAISTEVGKPLWESESEVAAMRGKIAISINAYHERCPEKKQGSSITRHKPHGVVAVFSPFNFPGHLPNGHIIPALLAGNTVVLKPSEMAPKVAELMIECWNQANLPRGVINMIQGGRETGAILANHSDLQGLFFTGSWQTGKLFLENYAKNPGKILALEMGGNNPLIVWEAKNLAAAAYMIIQSAYLTSGQRCTCARRLILPANDEGDKLLEELVTMIAKIRVAPFTPKPDPFMGPVISSDAAARLMEIQASLGGTSLVEMRRLKKNTGLITPGLIDVTSASNRKDEEIFGPLLQVIRVSTFEDALTEANNTEYGLAAGLLSSRHDLYEKFRHSIRAGIVNWNTALTGASSLNPFGGVGKSGNYHPSAYYAADYSAYPVASIELERLTFPENITPGIQIERKL